jgi:hypothetical protein
MNSKGCDNICDTRNILVVCRFYILVLFGVLYLSYVERKYYCLLYNYIVIIIICFIIYYLVISFIIIISCVIELYVH